MRDVLDDQALGTEGLCAAGEAAEVGLQDLGYKQVLDYVSGPWPGGALGAQQHRILQKVRGCRALLPGCIFCCLLFFLACTPVCMLCILVRVTKLATLTCKCGCLQAMAAGQDVCKAVLCCVAASRGVRLPPGSLHRLVESLPLDPQVHN